MVFQVVWKTFLSSQRQKHFAKGIRENTLYVERMGRTEWVIRVDDYVQSLDIS